MPYTLSHMGAVIPFRRWLRLDAALIGSCVPDFGYFIHWPLSFSIYSHSLLGSLILGVPISILLLWLFRSIEEGVCWLLKIEESGSPPTFQAREVLFILASIGLGILSHVFIDGFTHIDGWATERFPSLLDYFGALPLYKWLQYSLSVVGLVMLVSFYRTKNKLASSTVRMKAWLFILLISVIAASFYALTHYEVKSFRVLIVYALVVFTQAFLVGIVGVSIARIRR